MGWQTKNLGDLLSLEYGKPLEKNLRKTDGLYPAYGANGIKARTDEYFYDQRTIIIGRKGSAGELTLSEEKFWPLDVTYFVKFDEQRIDLFFLYRLLQTLNLPRLATGVKPGINRNSVYELEVSIPPLTEQKQIVAILDEAFANIDRARQLAERNLNNARELFDSHLKATFDTFLNSEYSNKELESLCELIVDCEHKTAPTEETGYPSIRTPNIQRGRLNIQNVNRVSEETYLQWTRRAVPLAGDLIMAREAPAGNVAVIPTGIKPCLGQRTLLIRPKSEIFLSDYLMWYLLSPEVQKRLLSTSRGATVQHVNMKDIRALEIKYIPGLSEQRRIVESIEKMLHNSMRLEKLYQQKITALDELKQSLLQKAFRGELTREQVAA